MPNRGEKTLEELKQKIHARTRAMAYAKADAHGCEANERYVPGRGCVKKQELPQNSLGMTTGEALLIVADQGQFPKEKANYVQPTPDPATACGACRFYLRDPEGSDEGLCELVQGGIAWSATCDLFIGAREEAEAVLAQVAQAAQAGQLLPDTVDELGLSADPNVRDLWHKLAGDEGYLVVAPRFGDKAVLTTAQINNLPDAAFAVVSAGGEMDDENKTVPRSLRRLPHHDGSVTNGKDNGSVLRPQLRNALARLPQADLTDEEESEAQAHLEAHAQELLPTSEAATEEAEKQERSATSVQTYILSRERFDSAGDARAWLDRQDIVQVKPLDETEDSFRARVFDPGKCQEGSERTIEIADGVKAVVCRQKGQAPWLGWEVRSAGALALQIRRAFDTPGSDGVEVRNPRKRLCVSLDRTATLVEQSLLMVTPKIPHDAPVVFVSGNPTAKEAAAGRVLAGPDGRTFRDLYLKEAELDISEVGLMHAVPVQVMDPEAINGFWRSWRKHLLDARHAPRPMVVALGHLAKRMLAGRADIVLPHPAAVRRKGNSGEVARKMRRVREHMLKCIIARALTRDLIGGSLDIELPGGVVKRLIDKPLTDSHRKFTKTHRPILKAEGDKQVVFGVVLSPYVVDTQDDWVPPQDIEDAAHAFIPESRVIGLNHEQKADAYPVESIIWPYPTPEDRAKAHRGEPHKALRQKFGVGVIRSGEWLLGTKVVDKEHWSNVRLDGEELGEESFGAYSLGGFGLRVPMLDSELPAVEFIDVEY